MAFLKVPVLFCSEDDAEKLENLGLDPEGEEGEIVINTALLCAYNEMTNKHTMARMANGDCVEIPLDIDKFEGVLDKVESIVTLANMGIN